MELVGAVQDHAGEHNREQREERRAGVRATDRTGNLIPRRPARHFGTGNQGDRAKTTNPLAGIVIAAEAGRSWSGGPSADTPVPLPATIGFTQLSYTSLLNTSTHQPEPGKPIGTRSRSIREAHRDDDVPAGAFQPTLDRDHSVVVVHVEHFHVPPRRAGCRFRSAMSSRVNRR